MSNLHLVLFAPVLLLEVHRAQGVLVQEPSFYQEVHDSVVLVSLVFLQPVRARLQIQVPAPALAQKFGMRRMEAPSLEVPLWAHQGAQMRGYSVDYVPAAPGVAPYWMEVHEMVVPSANPLLPRHHLQMHLEEPCCRRVSAHLSK